MLYLLTASIFWAFSYGLIKHFLYDLDPNFIATARTAVALALFLPLLRKYALSLPVVLKLFAIGAVQYGLTYVAYLHSFRYLESHQIALFAVFTPLYVVLVNSWLSRKKHFPWFYLCMALLALAGGSIIRYKHEDWSSFLIGFCIIQFSDLCFASGQIFYKRLRAKHTDLCDKDIYAIVFMGALSISLIAAFQTQAWEHFNSATPLQWSILAYLSIIATGLGFFFWAIGTTRVNTGTLAVANNLKVPLAVLISLLVFQENCDPARLACGTLVIALALYLTERRQKKTLSKN